MDFQQLLEPQKQIWVHEAIAIWSGKVAKKTPSKVRWRNQTRGEKKGDRKRRVSRETHESN